MKTRIFIATILALALPLSAATWNTSRGMGNPNDSWTFTGDGTPMTVIGSVQSNSLYYITSAKSTGEPQLDEIYVATDALANTFRFYIATNSWTVASNSATPGTNAIWITSTNLTMATNDFFVLQNVASDSYQLLVLGGGSSASGLHATNALGQNCVRFYNTTTNQVLANDKLYKMAQVQTYTPLGLAQQTNEVTAGGVIGTVMRLGGSKMPITFSSFGGSPTAVILTYSNAASLQVNGEYYVRPRR